jgi:hypothetical protein
LITLKIYGMDYITYGAKISNKIIPYLPAIRGISTWYT